MGESFRFRTWHAVAFLGAVSAVSALSASKDGRAYWDGLDRRPKPPPRWVFPTVWTGLNVLQVWADLRILNNRRSPDRNALIGLRAANWVLHALFTPALFRARAPVGGQVVSLAEGVTAGATVALLARSDPMAAAALAPLTLLTAYASLTGPEGPVSKPDRLVDRLRWDGAF